MKDTESNGAEVPSLLNSGWSENHFSLPPKRSIRIALQGGGVLGAYGAGFLMAADEDPHIDIEEGSGTSAGALNFFVFKHTGAQGLINYWTRIGRKGGAAHFVSNVCDPLGFSNFMPASLKASYFKAASMGSYLETPLSHIRSCAEDSLKHFALAEALPIDVHVSAVTKRDSMKGMEATNLQEIVYSADDVTLEHALASSALKDLAAFESEGVFLLNGVPHWDGIYSGRNPNLSMFEKPSEKPLVIITVDERTPRRSYSDPDIEYGRIHEQIQDFANQGFCPVYHTELTHPEHWPKQIRGKPSISRVDELIKRGYQDGLACLDQIKQDMGITVSAALNTAEARQKTYG